MDKSEKRAKVISYIVTFFFLIILVFPLFYIISLSVQGENAIYSYPPQIVPPAAQSVSIVLDYSKEKNLPEEKLKDTILRDSTLAMYSTIYELNKDNIQEIKVYGVQDGKTIYYSRAHGLALKFQMQYGIYYQCRILPDVLLYGDRYLKSSENIGYSFNPNGLGETYDKSRLGKNKFNGEIEKYLNKDFKTTGNFVGTSQRVNNLLMLENFKYYYQVPQVIYKDFENIRKYSFFAFMGNTLLTLIWTILCQVFIPAITAYPLSKLLSKRTANYILLFFLATMMIPFVVIMVPQLLLMKSFHMFNNYVGMLFPALAPAPFNIYLYKGFFDRIPSSYFDAARIDGANEVFTFSKICMPMSKPIIILITLQSFIWGWSDFFWYYLVANKPNLWTLNVAIYTFSQMPDQIKQNFLMGISLATILPVLILTAVFSKQIKQSVMGAGIKG